MNRWLKNYLKKNRLPLRFFLFILMCSLVYSLLASIIKYHQDYKKEMKKIEEVMILIHESYLDPMENSLWSFDINQMKIQAEGILSLPHIKRVAVYELFGGQGKPVFSLGNIEDKDYLKQSFELDYNSNGVIKHIGTLYVFAGMDHILRESKQWAVVGFFAKEGELLVLCMIIFLLFRNMVLRHLDKIHRFLAEMSTSPPSRMLTLDRRQGGGQDILDAMADAANTMAEKMVSDRSRISGLMAELDQSHNRMNQVLERMDVLEKMRTVDDDLSAILLEDLGIEPLAQKLINYLVRYFCAGVGLFYYVDGDHGLIRAVAGYAVALPRTMPISFNPGEGLVGQAVENRKPCLIQAMGENSLQIHSSLGQACPKGILIYPFSKQGRVTCVIEMGRFSEFEEEHIHLLDRVNEQVAMAVESAAVKEAKSALERRISDMEGQKAPVQ